MHSAWFDLGGVDSHTNSDTMNGLDGFFRLLFPPGHRLVDVLVEGFNLNRSKLEAFEPFLVVGVRQRLWRIVSEEVAWSARSYEEATWIECRCRWWTSLKSFLNRLGARGRWCRLVLLVLRVGCTSCLGQLGFEFQDALLTRCIRSLITGEKRLQMLSHFSGESLSSFFGGQICASLPRPVSAQTINVDVACLQLVG